MKNNFYLFFTSCAFSHLVFLRYPDYYGDLFVTLKVRDLDLTAKPTQVSTKDFLNTSISWEGILIINTSLLAL